MENGVTCSTSAGTNQSDKEGKVTGKSKGKATITVKMKSGCKAKCIVMVK